jgi:hypothetical protein
MARVVESVAADYSECLRWEKVVTKTLEGAGRYQQLSRSLGRPAPVPSIFINSELVFDSTPGPEELRACLNKLIDSTY